MSDDDSRGLEGPDRQDASTARADPADGETSDTARTPEDTIRKSHRVRLESIDTAARSMLADVWRPADSGSDARRDAIRHLRELCAEAECARRALARIDDDETAADRRDGGRSDGVPPVRRSGGVTVVSGPDPIAFERSRGDRDD